MQYNIEFQICSLVFICILAVVFFAKNRRWTSDNIVFAKLVICTFLVVLDDFLVILAISIPSVPDFYEILFGKIYLAFMYFCMIYFFQYAIALTVNWNDDSLRIEKFKKFAFKICPILALIFSIISFCLPLYSFQNGREVYVYGPSQNLCYYFGYVLVILVPVYAFLNRKKMTVKQQLPLYAYVVIQACVAIIESVNKELLLTTISTVVVIYLLYFTLQNPDIVILQEKNKKEELLIKQMIHALADSVDAKDHYTSGHSTRVAEYAVMIAKRLGYDKEHLRELFYMGLLHDVGKISVPDEIINKQGKLTSTEYDIVKTHTVVGGQMLEKISTLPQLFLGAMYHHEKFDGKGYPEGLVGDNIPTDVRILSVADSYDAMASSRSYRGVLPQAVIRAELLQGKGTQFDPAIADIMIEIIDEDVNFELKEKKI